MNSSITRLMLITGAIGAVCIGIAYVCYELYSGYADREKQQTALITQDADLQLRIANLEREKKEVDRWTAISLPGNVSVSGVMFKNYLQEMILKHKVTLRSLSDPGRLTTNNARQGTPVATHVSIDVVFEATLAQLSSFLQDFYSVNVPQSIKSIVIEPMGKGNEAKLTVTLKVDALAMSHAKIRDSIIASPTMTVAQLDILSGMKNLPVGMLYSLSQLTSTGMLGQNKLASKATPQREYGEMVKKNVFAGLASATKVAEEKEKPKLPDQDILKYAQLTSITANNITEEGLLRIRKTNKYVKLRAEGGINEFEIRDGESQLVLKGKVLAIKPRDLVFETKGKAYVLHIGQFVEEALKKELTTEELKKYDVVLTATVSEDKGQ